MFGLYETTNILKHELVETFETLDEAVDYAKANYKVACLVVDELGCADIIVDDGRLFAIEPVRSAS